MRLLDFLALQMPDLRPASAKLHLATWNGRENPLDEFLGGRFNEWQRWQSRRNFSRDFVVSLIALPETNRWLYAGVHRSDREPVWHEDRQAFHYALEEVPDASALTGRAVAAFERPGRQSYLNAETWTDRLVLSELRSERLRIADFRGYREVSLSFEELRVVVRDAVPSWRSALENVSGVYLISDTITGKLYVGSATGAGGIWARWRSYAETGHGGNAELRALMANDAAHASGLRFSILETADLQEPPESVVRRESHWKTTLLTRAHGLNAN